MSRSISGLVVSEATVAAVAEVVAEVVMAVTSMAVVNGLVEALVVAHLDGNLHFLHHLKWNGLGDVYWHLDGLDVLKSFGNGDVFDHGDLDGNVDGVGLGDELDLGGDSGVLGHHVLVGAHKLGVARFCLAVAPVAVPSMASEVMTMSVSAEVATVGGGPRQGNGG